MILVGDSAAAIIDHKRVGSTFSLVIITERNVMAETHADSPGVLYNHAQDCIVLVFDCIGEKEFSLIVWKYSCTLREKQRQCLEVAVDRCEMQWGHLDVKVKW